MRMWALIDGRATLFLSEVCMTVRLYVMESGYRNRANCGPGPVSQC